MTAGVAVLHICVDCKKLPEKPADVVLPSGANWVRAGYRPKRPGKIVTPAGKPPRCTFHLQENKRHRRVQGQARRNELTFGITEEEYWKLYEAQGRKCAFPRCRATGKVKRLAVDHDHEYAREHCNHDPRKEACRNCIRGLLCGPHNHDLMGRFAVDLEDALAYRDNPPARLVLVRA